MYRLNALLSYAPRILSLQAFHHRFHVQPVLIGITNGIFTILGLVIIDKVGRKKLLLAGSIGMAVCLGKVKLIYSPELQYWTADVSPGNRASIQEVNTSTFGW